MIDFNAMLRELDHTRGYHGISRPHDGPLYLQNERPLLALDLCCETASQGQLGMLLVGLAVMNRMRRPERFGATLSRVILKPAQFSWTSAWPQFRNRLRKAFDLGAGPDFEAWSVACGAAFDVLEGRFPDLTDGSDHYYARRIAPPSWAAKMTKTILYEPRGVGTGHQFLRE